MEYILATNFQDLNFSFGDTDQTYRRLGNWVDNDLVIGDSYEDEFRNNIELEHMNQDIQSMYQLLIESLTDELNNYDNRAFIFEEGMTLYGPWLHHMLSHYYYLYKLLKYINKRDKDAILVCGDDNYKMFFEDTLDHKKNIRYDVYNNYVIKIIANYIGINLCCYKNYSYSEVSKNYENHKGAFARKVVSKIENIINFRAKVLLKNSYINKKDRIKIFIRSAGVISTITNRPEKLEVNLNSNESRVSLGLKIDSNKVNDFLTLILENIINEIPFCYIEGFYQLKKQVSKNYKKWRPDVVVSANAWYHDEPFKLWAIQQKRKGAKLIGYQHGGVYFTYKNNFYLKHERLVTDSFFSWGNSGFTSEDIIPFYIQKRILNPKVFDRAKTSEIMLLTNNYSKQHHLLEIFQTPYNTHIEQNCIFLKGLNFTDNVKYRPFRTDYGWNEIEIYKNIYPNLKFSSHEKDVLDEISMSKVVIFDTVHSTSFLESIAMNIPSIILAKDFQNEINSISEPIFKKMKKNNIIFDSGKDCANFLNLNLNNIDKWWFSETTQAVVIEFTKSYAATSFNFPQLFVQEISKIRLS